MAGSWKAIFLFVAAAVVFVAADEPKAAFSGKWKLIVDKSDFGKAPKPVRMTVTSTINGDVMHAVQTTDVGTDEAETIEFTWYLDGKRHSTDKPFPGYSITKWDDNTLVNERESNDGAYKETIRVTLSADRKTATEEIQSKNPSGSNRQKLIWEKQ